MIIAASFLLTCFATFEVGEFGTGSDHPCRNQHQNWLTLPRGGSRDRDERPNEGFSIKNLAKKSLNLSSKTALFTARQSGKMACYLMKPKHVEQKELVGLWRLDQQISTDYHPPLECSTNIELTKTDVIVSVMGEDRNTLVRTPWNFKPAVWPRSAKVEFMTKAFVVKGHPQFFLYKGEVDRKLAVRSVLKIKGRIYRIERRGWRGKDEKPIQVGTFVARTRMITEGDSDDDFDTEENYEIQKDADEDDYSGYDDDDCESYDIDTESRL